MRCMGKREGFGSRLGKALLPVVALVGMAGAARASDPVFLTLLQTDADLIAGFPGEVVETLWRGAELRVRRCRVGATDPAWLARVDTIAGDPEAAARTAGTARWFLHQGALENLRAAGLDGSMLADFSARAAAVDDADVDYGSCEGFIGTLQRIYDRPLPGEATPAVIGVVCGQVQELMACHGAMPSPADRLTPDEEQRPQDP